MSLTQNVHPHTLQYIVVVDNTYRERVFSTVVGVGDALVNLFGFFWFVFTVDSVCKIDAQFDDEDFFMRHLGMSNFFYAAEY